MSDKAERIVYVVDDDESVRQSLEMLLTMDGLTARTFGSGECFLEAVAKGLAFGCVLLDIRMPGKDGLEVQRELRDRGFNIPVVVVTAHGDISLAVQAMKDGACDFVEKPYTSSSIVRAARAALERGVEEYARAREAVSAKLRIATLSPRERDVLIRMAAGRPNKIIAHELGLSQRTVEIHRAHVMTKLGVSSLSEAVRLAISADLPLLSVGSQVRGPGRVE